MPPGHFITIRFTADLPEPGSPTRESPGGLYYDLRLSAIRVHRPWGLRLRLRGVVGGSRSIAIHLGVRYIGEFR